MPSTSFPSSTSNFWSTPQKSTTSGNQEHYTIPNQVGDWKAIGNTPVAVVQESPLGAILNVLGQTIYLLIFGLGAGIALGDEIISTSIIVAFVIIPVLLGYLFRPKYEFYDSEMLRVSRSGKKQIDYSLINSVKRVRSRIVITLKENAEINTRHGRIVIPRDPKLPDGTDLSAWLESKVPQATKSKQDDTESDNTKS